MPIPTQTEPPRGVTGEDTASAEPGTHAGFRIGMREQSLTSQAGLVPSPGIEAPEFDAWLRGQLEALHGSVMREPVPERFLRILDSAMDR